MKKLLPVILVALLLSACCTTPAERAEPDAVEVIRSSSIMKEIREPSPMRE